MMFKEYLLENWPLLLILLAFVISLLTTVFFDKKTIRRMYFLIVSLFILSIVVFLEFYFAEHGENKEVRNVLMAIRYSATPLILALVIVTLIKRQKLYVFIPALVLAVINIISIFTGIVSSINDANEIVRGPIWLLPYIVVGFYSVLLIWLLFERSNKKLIEIVPIVFFAVALGSGLIFPFIFKSEYSTIFCVTIGIALFVYYEFLVLQFIKKDALTGLLNRHVYYADVSRNYKSITALISIDMNGLKSINDNLGHTAGDEALVTLSLCFTRSIKYRETCYRIGGDEFVIICRRTSEKEVLEVVEKIKKLVSETKYSCSIGYAFNFEGQKTIDDLLTESDAMMYKEKDRYYAENGIERRHQ